MYEHEERERLIDEDYAEFEARRRPSNVFFICACLILVGLVGCAFLLG